MFILILIMKLRVWNTSRRHSSATRLRPITATAHAGDSRAPPLYIMYIICIMGSIPILINTVIKPCLLSDGLPAYVRSRSTIEQSGGRPNPNETGDSCSTKVTSAI